MSSAARRISDLVAASPSPLRYEVIRHLLRVSEETMTEVLDEAVFVRLVARGADPFTYVPYTERVGEDLRDALGPDRVSRMRAQIEGATKRVFEDSSPG
jgi:hypothetical protein